MKFLIGYSPDSTGRNKPFINGLKQILNKSGGEVTLSKSWMSALGYASVENYSAIWIDWDILKKYYSQFHQKLYRLNKHLPIIIFIGNGQIDGQMCATNDLLFSVVPFNQLEEKAEELVDRLRLYSELLSEAPDDVKRFIRPGGFGPFIGNSPQMFEVYHRIIKVSRTDFTVLITGDSGTGKELVAKTIHELSSERNGNRFVSLNCAAIPDNLLESELFGYEKGAFTGANQSKPGKFELAHHGTMFLDEIGDMPLNLQAKLLRVLENRTIERLGGTDPKEVDVRLLAATNQDINSLVEEGNFRSELHYRLNVIPISLPSLVNRKDDILLLALHIIGKLTKKNSRLVQSVDWKLIKGLQNLEMLGNVRELENILIRVIFNSKQPNLMKRTLLDVLEEFEKNQHSDKQPIFDQNIPPLWYVEKNAIQDAMGILNGNISKVSSHLKISRAALYRKIKKYSLKESGDR
ncbi:sigma-54 dependent transcriptional regulator [bacterium]|nr:sigma-54 dependent transcriptional regulator [bacterium]MBU1064882.1 sigma-54 dependent transcriptional regulator [bacterium]MBU1634927.1 sigma-54 dependent transcriptional regulator [bacterium]MBU1872598.1 sigma-54 dependent transcriptional regulator [bacterium]